jgi:hypothetical protein
MEQALAFLFEPDVSLSARYWETLCRTDPLEPEKRLMLAVLEEAVRTYRKYLFTQHRLFSEVEEWFLEEDSDWLFSFESICNVLGLNPNHIRRRLLRWTATELAGCLDGLRAKNRRGHRGVKIPSWSDRLKERESVAL